MTTELEAKLIPGEGFRIPALDGLAGTEVDARPVRVLDATYYDTPDLELARWGITLRYRTGDQDRPWTLKLPQHVTSTRIARDELRFAGDEGTVPFEASDLVRGFTRGRSLTNVARLRTTRVPVQVRDPGGPPLIEIVDDSVAVLRRGREADHFREIEVEAETDSSRVRSAMKAAVAALLEAGCHQERPLPKLVRALGEPAQYPPPIVVTAIHPSASTAELIAHLTSASALEILMHDPRLRLGHDPEAVHLYRVAARRLRADLRTFSRFLEAEPNDALRAELAWLGRAAGPVRDLDVLAARFAKNASSLPQPDQDAASMLLAHLGAQQRDTREALLEALRSERYDRALQALIDDAHQPPIAAAAQRASAKSAAHFARRVVKRRWNQLAAVVDTSGENPTDAALHGIRISAKRCRYAAEAVAPVIGRPARRFAAGIEAIQTVLGDYHDTVVAETWLRDAAEGLVDCRVAIGVLVAGERRERDRLRRAWPKAWHRASRHNMRAWL